MRISLRRGFPRYRSWLILAACSTIASASLAAMPEVPAAVVRPGATAAKATGPDAPDVRARLAASAPRENKPQPRPGPRGVADAALYLRDPFRAPEEAKPAAKPVAAQPRPPGVRGLLVQQIRLQGIVREEVSHRMMAMVAGQTNLSYFLREGDQLFDGQVSRITSDTLYLRRTGPIPATVPKEVALRIEPDAGGQQ
ncbi:MAG TPA: hypothetical protein VGZ29_02030 [Terriglobia bacterium]|nr:hypothetical protein [Terriglobia bacterium]